MAIKGVTQLPAYDMDIEQRDLSQKGKSLKGVTFPEGVSLEHAMFNHKLGNKVCPADIYDVNFKTVVKSIKDIKVKQLTAGDGTGGG